MQKICKLTCSKATLAALLQVNLQQGYFGSLAAGLIINNAFCITGKCRRGTTYSCWY
ncbi:MAG: hypothetical protein IKM15_07705 [Peptococcaceae bacterium]|nr:hypothetical protein [Peptococcaceae bacterium]